MIEPGSGSPPVREADDDPVHDPAGNARLTDADLRATIEQSPISLVVFDAAGHAIAVNAAFERLWGIGLADVPPEYSVLTDPQVEASGLMPLFRRAFAGEAVTLPPLRFSMAKVAGGGSVIWTQARAFPVRNRAGGVEQVILSHGDISARVGAEEALVRTAARAERIQALSSALSVAATPREVASAVVEHAQAVFDAVGVVVTHLTPDGQRVVIIDVRAMPDDIRQAWMEFPLSAPVPLAEVVRTGEPVFVGSREEWTERYPGMEPLLEETGHHANAVMPLIVNGRVIGSMGVAFDKPRSFGDVDRALAASIAQQCAQAMERARLYEAERVARREAEEANRAKSEFLAAMSHELRTPLNAIAGHVQLLEMGIYGPVTPEQQEALARIEKAQRYLLRHVNDVLNFARLRVGRVEYHLEPVGIVGLMAELEPLFVPQLEAKRLVYRADVDAGQVALADREKLGQVMLNLLSNAIKFTPPQGEVVIECVERSDGTGDPGLLFIRVTDSGIGIPRDKCSLVFEPFVQVDATPAGRSAGSGLGLAIARDLVRGMAGELRVRSTPGVGTSFTIALPRA